MLLLVVWYVVAGHCHDGVVLPHPSVNRLLQGPFLRFECQVVVLFSSFWRMSNPDADYLKLSTVDLNKFESRMHFSERLGGLNHENNVLWKDLNIKSRPRKAGVAEIDALQWLDKLKPIIESFHFYLRGRITLYFTCVEALKTIQQWLLKYKWLILSVGARMDLQTFYY